MPATLKNSAVDIGLETTSFHSNPKERQCQRMFKLPHNWLITHVSKVMLKILQAMFQQYINWEFPDVQPGFRKGRGTRDQMPISVGSSKKQNVPEKYLLLLYWLCQSLWLGGSQSCGDFFKKWEYQTTWLASWEICMQVKKQQLELDMEQQTGSKLGKEYIKVVYCHLLI